MNSWYLEKRVKKLEGYARQLAFAFFLLVFVVAFSGCCSAQPVEEVELTTNAKAGHPGCYGHCRGEYQQCLSSCKKPKPPLIGNCESWCFTTYEICKWICDEGPPWPKEVIMSIPETEDENA